MIPACVRYLCWANIGSQHHSSTLHHYWAHICMPTAICNVEPRLSQRPYAISDLPTCFIRWPNVDCYLHANSNLPTLGRGCPNVRMPSAICQHVSYVGPTLTAIWVCMGSTYAALAKYRTSPDPAVPRVCRCTCLTVVWLKYLVFY